jgi:hypothetical protein
MSECCYFKNINFCVLYSTLFLNLKNLSGDVSQCVC